MKQILSTQATVCKKKTFLKGKQLPLILIKYLL